MSINRKMKMNIKLLCRFIISTTLLSIILLLSGCPLFHEPVLDAEPINYHSKEVEYSRYVDSVDGLGGFYLEPVETRVYNDEGKLDAVFLHFYDDDDFPGTWLLTKTEVYEVDRRGSMILLEYYRYEYEENSYTEYDDEGEAYEVFEYLLTKGEAYDPEYNKEHPYHYYEAEYEIFTNQPAGYNLIKDWRIDEIPENGVPSYTEIARQVCTYAEVVSFEIAEGPDVIYYDYIIEKFFDTSPAGSDENNGQSNNEMALSEEFASWYDDYGLWTHELYHTTRSSENNDNENNDNDNGNDNGNEERIYYYTKYDWNEAYQVYKQQDFVYHTTTDDPPVLAAQADAFLDGTYDDDTFLSGAYDLNFENIGALHESLTITYDDLGNDAVLSRTYHGSEHERVVYRYNSHSEQISKIRYVGGRSVPQERVETRYRTENRDGVYYRIREEYTYKSNVNNMARASQSAISRTIYSPASLLRNNNNSAFRRIRSSHER